MNSKRWLFVNIIVLVGAVFISCGGRKNGAGQISASESGQEIALPTRDNPLYVSGLPEHDVCGMADCRPDSAEPDSGKSAVHKIKYGSFVDTLKITEKGYRNQPLSDKQRASNRRKSSVRCRVEHVFGFIVNSMNGMNLRSTGILRAKLNIGLTNLIYNMCRYEFLVRSVSAG